MEVNGAPELLCFPHSSEYLPLCSAEQRHSYRFGTTWGGGELWQNFHFWLNYPFKTLICCTLCAAELICMWKQSSSVSCCCINSCSIVCEPWSNCLFAFSPELTCCSDSVPSTITSQAGNPSSNPSSLRLPLLIPSQVQSLAPILVDAERRTAIRIWGLFYWSFSSLKGS